jgi:hypothetical protein
MADQPKSVDVEKIKTALVNAGLLKATRLSKEDEAKIREQLARNHIEVRRLRFQILCHSNHYCIIVRDIQ